MHARVFTASVTLFLINTKLNYWVCLTILAGGSAQGEGKQEKKARYFSSFCLTFSSPAHWFLHHLPSICFAIPSFLQVSRCLYMCKFMPECVCEPVCVCVCVWSTEKVFECLISETHRHWQLHPSACLSDGQASVERSRMCVCVCVCVSLCGQT